jgi:ATP adenylyltransferase
LGAQAVLRDHLAFWAAVVDRAEAALAAGAMHSFQCALEYVEDAGVEFVLRIATRFPPGENAAGRTGAAPKLPANPFASPEPALLVAELTPTHRALLNKFSVLREHLLIVTREFQDQRALLDERDFEALAVAMEDAEVLAFYNGGTGGGASQKHKHLQVVTLPLSPRHSVPMDALLAGGNDRLPFRHAFARLAPKQATNPPQMLSTYMQLHRDARLEAGQPYNLVVTHEWMLVVPRSRDRFEDISINSLAFAGSFFLRDAAHAHQIVAARPMNVLKSVAMP